VRSQTQSVIVTGVAGFIGRYVARFFSQQNWRVIGIDNSPTENAPIHDLAAYHCLKLPSTELSDLFQIYTPNVCIHCAGKASVGLSISNPVADFYGNTVLTFEILNALRLYAPTCRFVFLSSASVYGNPISLPVNEAHEIAPLSPYGFHKSQCEQLCVEFSKIYGVPTASLRIFSAYGSGLRRQVLWDICQKVINTNSLTLQGTGKESRDFIHASDIARAIYMIATLAPMEGEAYNLGSGNETTILKLAKMILKSLEYKCLPIFDQIIPLGTPLNWQADISKLKSLGFESSVSLKQGVASFAVWSKSELQGY